MTIDHPLDEFTQAYIDAALWSTNDESTPEGGDPLDDNYGPDDFADAALAAIVKDCLKFQQENKADIGIRSGDAGHDFWLTRNGHGCGFWDGDWPEPMGSRLDNAAKKFGSIVLCVGDTGKIHHANGS